MFRSPLFLCLLSLVSTVAYSQSLPASPFEGAAFSMPALAVRSAAAAIPADKLSDVTILFEETTYRIAETGAVSYTHRNIYRIDTHKGVEGWAESSIGWDPWYQTPSQIHARVLQTDGTFATLDQKTITDAPINNDSDGTYTSSRIRKAPLPGLAVGSIVEEVLSVDDKRPYFVGGSAYRQFFTNNAPTERERLIVELPSTLPFKDHIANLPNLVITRTETNGLRRIVYEQPHTGATTSGDIELSSTSAPTPIVEFSTGASWANVARDYASLSDPHILTDQVRALLPSTPAASRLATIQQLVQRLHKEVRYTGIEFDEAQLTPQSPAEVLKRHYGDCKDKATFLVALLRAANIPAHLALLSSGTNADVNPDLPGMNRFNHAIVYVPAGSDPASAPPIWIDATAEFSAVGTLPFEDANRLALIISPTTTALTATPLPVPEDSILVENRTFTLPEVGPSHVVESSNTTGTVDAYYRSEYGSAISKKLKDSLEKYAQNAYLAKTLTSIDHGDGTDFSQPFHLTLTIDGARRGATSLVDAVVAIFPTGTLSSLPQWISTPPTPLADDATQEQKEERARSEARRSPTYQIRPYIAEQRYRITVPAGFDIRALPPDRTTPLGPASITEHYAKESPTLITATLRFNTGKSNITQQEALDFRQGIADFSKREVIMIVFEQTGAKLLADGKIKEALAADQSAIAQNPRSALPHVRLARALLTAGVGDMAHKEAARALELEPSSAAALTTQGWVLQHDLLGRRFGAGYDRAGAVAAFRKALPLHSEDFDPRFDLAILYEFDAVGVRYSPSSNLPEAIAIYRDLIDTEQKKNSTNVPQYRVNLAIALFFHHEYKAVDALNVDIPAGINHSTLAIASAVAQKDVAAGIAAADHLNVNADERNKGLISAGTFLAQLGLYAQSSEILAAGIQGQNNAPAVARQIEMYRNLKRVPLASPPITSPDSLIFAMMNYNFSGLPDRKTMQAMITEHGYPSQAAFDRDQEKGVQSVGFLHAAATNAGIADAVLRDILLGSLTIKSTGTDATGYRVLCHIIGGQTSNFFVVKEANGFRIVADGDHDTTEIGYFALYALDHNQPALAKNILDWRRELMHKGGGDDPFSGDLLPRFWTVGSTREGADSPESMRVAATSLIVGSMDAKTHLDTIAPLRDKASGAHQTDFNLLLAKGYLGTEQTALALPYITALLKEEPDSTTALNLAGAAYSMNGDTKSWKALLTPKLAARPTDADLLRAQMRLQIVEKKYIDARLTGKAIFDSGKATSSDYNGYAWTGLFDDHLGQDITEAAQQSNVMSKNANFGDLHTMACIYAAQGKITEAQQVLTQAMTAGNMSEPNSEVWYTLGLLYENYGLREAALAAFQNVKAHPFDDHTYINPESTYTLAQKAMARLIPVTKAKL